jgi:Arc/MetJ-type ribon-helix-helix transcriptional regulator
MIEEPRDVRLPIMVTRTEAQAIDDWRFKNRFATRAEAIRQLIQLGLRSASSAEPPAR